MLALEIFRRYEEDPIERIEELASQMMNDFKTPSKLIIGPVVYDKLLRKFMTNRLYTPLQLKSPLEGGVRMARYATFAGELEVVLSKNPHELRVEE